MTTVDHRTQRDVLRLDLATLVDVDPELLADGAELGEAGLDSLGMMRLINWMEGLGAVLDGHELDPRSTVGEVLTLVGQATGPGISIRYTAGGTVHGGLVVPSAPEAPVDPLAPVLSTRALRLTPVRPDDLGFLYDLAASSQTSFRWRYRGAPPPIERYAENLWTQVLVQYVARRAADQTPVGHVVAYGAEMTMRYCYIGAVFVPEVAGTGLAAQAVSTFIRYLFHIYPLHKMYLQVPGYNFGQFSSGQGDLFEVEGVLRDHIWFGGQVWDEYMCAVYADRFREGGELG
jgi:RimJ/RimL family protein N-acetyltransferase/aryl carrier-like protein